ncbi:unnamed protein product [Cylicostephanus goldi]|uniref:Mos1 transposase HTH domain-containing protein n=1 Tax=Cylicostephanus goldi TaxID=71465 RepID=A0A3P6RK66_CYLGO|nr:unnamed protein product [Cylicostephanus goldi]
MKRDFRLTALHGFKFIKQAPQQPICTALGEIAPTPRIVQIWFSLFKCGELTVDEKPRCGHPLYVIEEHLLQAVDEDPSLAMLNHQQAWVSASTVRSHLHENGRVKN